MWGCGNPGGGIRCWPWSARRTHGPPRRWPRALALTLIPVVLGASIGLEPWRLTALGAAMLCGQASVGLSNDWLDAERSLRSRP